jgi:hypothetical protein
MFFRRSFNKVLHNIRMHLTGYSELRPLPQAGDASVKPLFEFSIGSILNRFAPRVMHKI